MFPLLLLVSFTVLVVTEISLLVTLHDHLGFIQTVLLVVATGILGGSLARQQGLALLWRIRQQSSTGQMPADALLDGALILVAGAVLITPGVLTDAMGFALLVPPVRSVIKRWIKRWFARRMEVQAAQFKAAGFTPPGSPERSSREIIDVEVIQTTVDDV